MSRLDQGELRTVGNHRQIAGELDCIPREREGQAEELCVPIGGCWSRHLGYVLDILEWEHFSFVCGERGGFQQSDFQTFSPCLMKSCDHNQN